jgi:hypothetical protein
MESTLVNPDSFKLKKKPSLFNQNLKKEEKLQDQIQIHYFSQFRY